MKHSIYTPCFPTAEYVKTGVARWDGNPLIEALPPVLEDQELSRKLAQRIPYDDSERKLPPGIRRHLLESVLSCYIPLEENIEISQAISRLIRFGYRSRDVTDPKWLFKMRENREAMTSQMRNTTQHAGAIAGTIAGSLITGHSGMGKTATLDRTFARLPQVIEHTNYGGKRLDHTQLVWLIVDIPFDASIKGLAAEFFSQVDRALGQDYRRVYMKTRTTTDELMPDMATVASNHTLGVLVFDEIQHISAAKSGGDVKMARFWTTLSNKMKIPIVLVGTPQCDAPLGAMFQSGRRACGHGAVNLAPMKNDEHFRHFLSKLWKYQYTTTETPLSDQLADAFHDETQGITSVIVSLYVLVQDAVIGSGGSEKITEKTIRRVAKASFKPIAAFLSGLRMKCKNATIPQLKPADALALLEKQRAANITATAPNENPQKPRTSETSGELPNLLKSAGKENIQSALSNSGIIQGIDGLLKNPDHQDNPEMPQQKWDEPSL